MPVIDAFGRTPMVFGRAFAADSAIVMLSAPGIPEGPGLLVQSMNYQYQQPIQRIYELSSNSVYYVAGRPQGQGSLSRIIGPTAIALAFYTAFGNVCIAGQNSIMIIASGNCFATPPSNPLFTILQEVQAGNVVITYQNAVTLNSISGSVQAENMLFNEQLGYIFCGMNLATGPEAVGPVPPSP